MPAARTSTTRSRRLPRPAEPRKGDTVRVAFPEHARHGQRAEITKVWNARLNGFPLGRLYALRFRDGSGMALPADRLAL